ncbi:MAG: T9SS type A sorting domain-containing protein [Saprospiraceae bacterium]
MKNLLFLLVLILVHPVFSQNCSAIPTGLIPINDLGTGTFNGWMGGLYPNGSNFMPTEHKINGLALSQQVKCLDKNGVEDSNGKIVWLSIGMSNCTQETQKFIPLANNFPEKNPQLVLVDGAQGSQTANIISTPSISGYANFWTTVNTRLSNAGVTNKQVQVIWLKEANPVDATPVQTYYDSLVVQFKRIANELTTRFPNVKLCYVSSRISARYATSTLNPEPHSYRTGWAIKKLIEDQINGDQQLNYLGNSAKAPWLSWGIYMWSDGDHPQSANSKIFWKCPEDFNTDGTHPSNIGAQKVASLLLDFFKSDSTATPWFLGKGCAINTLINNKAKFSKELSFSPNPTDGKLIIRNLLPDIDFSVKLNTLMGKRVFSNSNTDIIDLSNYPQGVYLLTVWQNSKCHTSKIIKL